MKLYEILETTDNRLTVDFTTEYIKDKKRYVTIFPPIEAWIRRFVEFKISNPTRPISKKDYNLHGKLKQYSHVHLGGDLFLIYLIANRILLLVAIATHDEIKPAKQKQLKKSLDNIVNKPRPIKKDLDF